MTPCFLILVVIIDNSSGIICDEITKAETSQSLMPSLALVIIAIIIIMIHHISCFGNYYFLFACPSHFPVLK